ncbi:enoyl-(acyl carrier protein) reductase [Candidatus Magnetobacterium bavaricum]|uniref:Enoyl-(Acyl carrier protein) reductase n=1 Tax=Candidatus Magnetobacterium bavaricum TaxID=29290 RepID=A0A0F3GRH1_9BACT|nr:enoyl-(acyl carrier protein) reductase [Candidatus Magnetobacterium bavaricum]
MSNRIEEDGVKGAGPLAGGGSAAPLLLFSGKVALVTGGSRGIGRAIALRFAANGADVVVNHRRAETPGSSRAGGIQALCQEIEAMGVNAYPVQADISSRESVKQLMAEIMDKCRKLDFLVLNAAKAPFKPIERLLERELRELVDVNYLGNIFCVKEALPLLEKKDGQVRPGATKSDDPVAGRIVFISSLGSRFYNPAYPLGSMKAAMESVVRDLSQTLGERGIMVNAVSGGLVKTDSFKVLRQYMEGVEKLPEGLFVQPEEIADVVMFLCSDASRAIAGQTIIVDRGLSNRLYRPALP